MRQQIKELINRQQETYKYVFLMHQDNCHTPKFHYDWWMFPVPIPSRANVTATTKYFAVNQQDTVNLLNHRGFITTYLRSLYQYVENLQHFSWNHYPIRYAKMLLSVAHFITVSNSLVGNKNIAAINQILKGFAKEAVSYAKAHQLQHTHPLLQTGLNKLEQLLPAQRPSRPRPR